MGFGDSPLLESVLPLGHLFMSHFGVLQEESVACFIDSSRKFVQDMEATINQVLVEIGEPMSPWRVADIVRQQLGCRLVH